jgi:hypothetical protein
MAYIIKDSNRFDTERSPWYYYENEDDFEDIKEVEENYDGDEIRQTVVDYEDLYDYTQSELEELFNEGSIGYVP